MLDLPIYLDHSATTPCDPRVAEAMMPYFTQDFGNASSRSHAFGWKAEAAVNSARQQVAALIGAAPGEIIFTSGATESCNLALRGVFEMYAAKGNHIITTATEHKAVLDTCKLLRKKGAEITIVNPGKDGRVSPDALETAINSRTVLIAVMYANNETGVIHPIKKIGAMAKRHNVLFFCDATQAVGKIPVDVVTDNIDLLALSAHKIYGPKGTGALYVRRRNPRVRLKPQITGGGQEHDLRSGTLNVPGIVGLGKACAIAQAEMGEEYKRLKTLRNHLEEVLCTIEASQVNGDPLHRLPQVCNISFKAITSSQMLAAVNKTIAISSGSACTSGTLDPSFVLTAMGTVEEEARGALRFSLGRFNTEEEVDLAIAAVKKAVNDLRSQSFEWELYKKEKG